MHERLPNSEIVVSPNSSHMPFFEEEEKKKYLEVLTGFLEKHRGQGQ